MRWFQTYAAPGAGLCVVLMVGCSSSDGSAGGPGLSDGGASNEAGKRGDGGHTGSGSGSSPFTGWGGRLQLGLRVDRRLRFGLSDGILWVRFGIGRHGLWEWHGIRNRLRKRLRPSRGPRWRDARLLAEPDRMPRHPGCPVQPDRLGVAPRCGLLQDVHGRALRRPMHAEQHAMQRHERGYLQQRRLSVDA